MAGVLRTFSTSKPVDLQATKADLDEMTAALALLAPLSSPTFYGYATFSDYLIAGNPGLEAAGIDINGTTYEATFKVSGIGDTSIAQAMLHRHSTTLSPVLLGARSNSDTDAHGAVTTGQALLQVYAAGYTGTHYDLFGAMALQVGTGTVSSTSSPGKFVLSVTQDGEQTPTPALTVDSDLSVLLAGKLTTVASSSAEAGFNLPEGTPPSAPVDGDVWTTTAGLFYRIGGVTLNAATVSSAVATETSLRAFAAAHG